MKRTRWVAVVSVMATVAAGIAVGPNRAGAAELDPDEAAAQAVSPAQGGNGNAQGENDNPDGPLSARQRTLKAKALKSALKGKSQAQGKVVQVAKGQYVELAREATDKVFVIITDFGNTSHAAYPGGLPGPAANTIPQPDRTVDNTTLWKPDYNKAHYEDMYFNRMAAYYQSQSSGRYSVQGEVTEWVRVPFNEARYGRDFCGGIVCSNTWFLIRDAMAFWTKDQLAQGKTMAQINAYLSTFDLWDRYDADADGNFDEADGYIDHFQIVHGGQDQAAGDPIYGTDAIWSHRWYAQINPFGSTGPVVNGQLVPFGGVNIGQGGTSSGLAIPNNRTAVWVGDYTIQPENGGLGVFVHEYGHDLGLPDLYDTSGNTGGAENSTGFWTLMSSGANIGNGGPNGIGDHPTDLGAWEKLQLGWLGCGSCAGGRFYELAEAGKRSEHKLGPNNQATKQAQALVVVLPDKQVQANIGAPYDGSEFWYSGAADNLNVRLQSTVTLPAAAQFSAKVRYDAEVDYDFGYLSVSTNNGATWTNVHTNLSVAANNEGIDGSSNGNWVDLTANLGAYAGQTLLLAFRYVTDGAVVEAGFSLDNLAINVAPLAGLTAVPATGGFRLSTGVETTFFMNAYIGEYRNYRGYDTSLATAYNFGFLNARPDWVEFFRYQDGLLLTYWDTSQNDNGVGNHPGHGQVLPIDAHPAPMTWSNGAAVRPRIQTYDSTFGLDPTDAITLNRNSVATTWASQPAVPGFDDTQSWWSASNFNGWVGVDVPKTGTKIRVKSTSAQGAFMQVQVN